MNWTKSGFINAKDWIIMGEIFKQLEEVEPSVCYTEIHQR